MASHPSPPQPVQPVQPQDSYGNGHSPSQDFQGHAYYSWITPHDMALLREIGIASGHGRSHSTTMATMTTTTTTTTTTIPISISSTTTVMNATPYHHTLKVLPKGTRPVKLIGEGSANAVFEIRVPESNRNASLFRGLLLRVAKVASPGQAPAFDYLRQQKFFQSVIQPDLGEYTVRQELVILYNTDIVNHLNKYLRANDHTRKDKFKGTFVGQSDWGLLVEDMRPQEHANSLFFEFKPKWLLQSPSAPKNAIRCRQCAMELYHMVTKPASQKCFPKDKPCPLALANDYAHPRVSSPSRIAFDLPSKQLDEPTKEALSRVANHPAISDLRELQASLDTIGPLNATPNNADFTLAMTLRDCTCFVQVGDGQPNAKSPLPIKIRLSDFDWKDPNVKAERWRRAEQELIQGGYYTADWIFAGGQLYHPPTLCQLEWKHRRRTDDIEVICLMDKSTSRCQETVHDPEAFQLPAHTKTFHHSTDLKFLHKRLQPFKKEPPGTPLESMLNPYRSQFSI